MNKKRCSPCEEHLGVVGVENPYGFLALLCVAALCFLL